jgi:hypothetical protein
MATHQPIADVWTLHDQLGRRQLVEDIAEQIVGCNANDHMAFGIHGDWGAGKTSMMRQLRYHLDGDGRKAADQGNQLEFQKHKSKVVTVWFEAWRYQHEPVPVAALLRAIRDEFSLRAKLAEAVTKTLSVTTRAVFNAFDDVAKLLTLDALPVSTEKIQSVGEGYEREQMQNQLSTDHIRELIAAALQQLKKKHQQTQRVVIFIDDLDRCSPDTAFRLLEGLKIYLNIDNCAFVIGMNQQAVVGAIASKLPASDKPQADRIRAEAYLEKICSYIWRLPVKADFNTYLQSLLNHQGSQTNHLPGVIATALLGANNQPLNCLPPNPRRIKALANVLCRYWHGLDTARQTAIQSDIALARALLFVAYLYQFHSDLYQRLQYRPDFYDAIRGWVKESGGDDSSKTNEGTMTSGYFSGLFLPDYGTGDESKVSTVRVRYPDPNASDMFWIAPLVEAMDNTLSRQELEKFLPFEPR